MKYTNIIRLLAVLLCALLALSACSSPSEEALPENDQPSTETAPDAENGGNSSAPIAVEPVLKNFFTFTGVKAWNTLSTVDRLDGEIRYMSSGLVVLSNKTIDAMNKATETYTVYNTELGTAVLTVSNTYTHNGNYTNVDWYDLCTVPKDPTASVLYPESDLDVVIRSAGRTEVIEVRRAIFTPINEDTDETDVDLYDVKTSYEYYDVTGQKLTETVRMADIYGWYGDSVLIGGVEIVFDEDTGKAKSIVDPDKGVLRLGYDFETETYGYYLNQYQPSALGYHRPFFEVYNKADGALVLRYYPELCSESMVYPLQNGNVLLQCATKVEEGMEYDVALGSTFYTIDTYIVDVSTGKANEIDFGYVIRRMTDREDFSDWKSLEDKGIYATENVINLAYAIAIPEDKAISADTKELLLVLNNDGSVMFKFESIIPEHRFSLDDGNPFGFEILTNGDYLVTLIGNIDSDYAIVTQDGRVRSYLPKDAKPKIAGEFVILSDGVYDYDLNKLYDFEEYNLQFATVFNDRILVRYIDEDTEDGTRYYELYREEGVFHQRDVFGGHNVRIEKTDSDYILVVDMDIQKEVLYNVEFMHLLTAQEMDEPLRYGDRYLVRTYVTGGPEIYYTVG